MTDTLRAEGRCLCGAVKIYAETVSLHLSACHCGMCRTWSGGPFLAVDCGTRLQCDGESHIKTYASSPWAERSFCSECGTHLFYRINASGEHFVPVGLFETLPGVVFEQQIFIDRKPEYYAFANRTQNMTEAEVFALFSAPQ